MYLHSSSAYGVQPVTIILGRKFKGVTESLGSKREFNSSTDSVESRWYGVKSENMAWIVREIWVINLNLKGNY